MNSVELATLPPGYWARTVGAVVQAPPAAVIFASPLCLVLSYLFLSTIWKARVSGSLQTPSLPRQSLLASLWHLS